LNYYNTNPFIKNSTFTGISIQVLGRCYNKYQKGGGENL
jgi:hypothetical protein